MSRNGEFCILHDSWSPSSYDEKRLFLLGVGGQIVASLLGGSHHPIDLNPDRSVGGILEIRNSDSTRFKDTDQKTLISGQLMPEMIQYCGK